MTMSLSTSKAGLRRKFREILSGIEPRYREMAASLAARQLSELNVFKESEHIACYLALNSEFDATAVIETIWQAKKHCYLPLMVEGQENKKLTFVRYQYGDALHENKHGILEPAYIKHTLPAFELDLVIMPLIAFDCFGHRLGTGGGYYDRTFAFLKDDEDRTSYLMGLGFGAQQIDMLPHDDWDISLNGILTEHEFIRCS